LDVIFGAAKPLSGSVAAVAVMLALVALVAVDGKINLFGAGLMDKRAARFAVSWEWQSRWRMSFGPA
jgi:hypothetical protein